MQIGEHQHPRLQIEVGKKYRTRSGDVVEIVGRFGSFVIPFKGVQQNGCEWWIKKDGTAPLSDGRNHKDLIEEITEP
jgi:hypothetical protein